MIEAVYAVLLHGVHVGDIYRRDSFTKFILDSDYWDRPDRAVLGRWFEDHPNRRPHATNRVPAWFSNLLPEGRLRDLIAREQGVSSYREIDLLVRIGRDLPGAVEIVPDPQTHIDTGLDGSVEDSARTPEVSSRVRFSLAGMGMKLSMRQDGDRIVLPAHGEGGDWIVKVPDAAFPRLPANELAVMGLARDVGIEVPETRMVRRDRLDDLGAGTWPSDEVEAYMVRRFDRSVGGRVHMEDFAQVLGCFGSGEGKYQSSVETVAAIAYRGQDRASLREMVRRTVFNLLVGNGDAHLKNWSLIYPDRKRARLSPAYDLVCTAVYLPAPGDPELGLPFFGAARLSEVSREHFARLKDLLRVGDGEVLNIVDETLERFCDAWADGAGERMPPPVAEWIGAHVEQTRSRLRTSG
ncbi:type II toxin-antitoxin system HipA family toxin [Actinomyces israelii]|uniref:type II toxin-antitoxin system HipA family toxin n=1 Tax=Actinomyces israelii TaxID=1659 RepID=UPI002554BC5C|nr:HipA domain-containing protein [Actinomyces israelii]WKR23226.1 Serine/threonine-protein kinase toxin HipA [Actinomyces israelii]